jgi:hypothetical protein
MACPLVTSTVLLDGVTASGAKVLTWEVVGHHEWCGGVIRGQRGRSSRIGILEGDGLHMTSQRLHDGTTLDATTTPLRLQLA